MYFENITVLELIILHSDEVCPLRSFQRPALRPPRLASHTRACSEIPEIYLHEHSSNCTNCAICLTLLQALSQTLWLSFSGLSGCGGRRDKKPPSLRCPGKNSPIPIIDARAVRRFAALRLFSVSLLCRSAAAPLRHSFLRSVVSLLLPNIDIACPPLQASTIVARCPHDIALFFSSTFYAACIYLGSASWTNYANSRYHTPCAPLRVFS